MLGLKTQESEKFKAFHNLIQEKANEQKMVWFLEAGDGHEFENEMMEGEDLSGWLIPKERSAMFEREWLKTDGTQGLEKWLRFFKWVEWKMDDDGNVTVEFVDE